jgi:hypothetical protein
MNSGIVARRGMTGRLPSQSTLLAVHSDDHMFLDVFAHDLSHTSIGEQPLDGLPPLDFGNPDSPAVEFPQA